MFNIKRCFGQEKDVTDPYVAVCLDTTRIITTSVRKSILQSLSALKYYVRSVYSNLLMNNSHTEFGDYELFDHIIACVFEQKFREINSTRVVLL